MWMANCSSHYVIVVLIVFCHALSLQSLRSITLPLTDTFAHLCFQLRQLNTLSHSYLLFSIYDHPSIFPKIYIQNTIICEKLFVAVDSKLMFSSMFYTLYTMVYRWSYISFLLFNISTEYMHYDDFHLATKLHFWLYVSFLWHSKILVKTAIAYMLEYISILYGTIWSYMVDAWR